MGKDLRTLEGALVAERYRLTRFIDEGAFGAVFCASHLAFGVELREVAIKIGREPMEDGRARRTLGDALTMARLSERAHDATLRDHFVTVHDAGRFTEGSALAGHPYLVMELVRGGSIRGFLKSGAFPLKRATTYFDQVLEALAFMHGGTPAVVHRDLKPANVLVARTPGASDVLKVADFGLALEVDSLLGWVRSGGDLAYLAPESLSRDICSPQSDVYMLGLLFYEMLSGASPFREVGRHLRGGTGRDAGELRRLHLQARCAETFPLLETHEELRLQPARASVIRTALQADLEARRYSNACELRAAWLEARDQTAPRSAGSELPWVEVQRLTREAEHWQALDPSRATALLQTAAAINRDRARVPDAMSVGRTYLLDVRRLIAAQKVDEAGHLAKEAHRRRKCRSTLMAMAEWYDSAGSPAVAAQMRSQGDSCPDRE